VRERIDIQVPEAVLGENEQKQERLARTYRLEPADRAPVVVDATFWTILAARGVRFAEFIASPRSHLREQILNFKWRVENIRDDQPIETRQLVLQPDFGSLRGTEFPIEIEWLPDQPPKSIHLLTEPEQIDDLASPDPWGGLNAKKLEFYHGMRAALPDFDVRLNGQPLDVAITLTQPGGPIPSAFALCGSNLFLWMKTEPERVHRLLDLVTTSHLQCIASCDQLTGTPPSHFIWTGADAADMVSPKTFKEFVVPYYLKLWQHFPRPRIFHMCGRINHLLESIRDDLLIDRMDGFGFPVDRQLLEKHWAGRVVMRGGPHPMLTHTGPFEAIQAECESYLRTAGSRGGYILSEGFGLMPGTPPENIQAMVQASRAVAQQNQLE
jgi:hypothetical protein